MSKGTGLSIVMGIAFFSASVAISGTAFATTTNHTTESANPFNGASADIELLQYARGGRRGGGGRGRGGMSRGGGGRGGMSRGGGGRGGMSRGGRGRPSAGRPGGGRPGAGRPGHRPGAGRPGHRPGRNVNVNVNVRHRGYGWRGTRWGAVAWGVTLGTAIIVAANTPPVAPNPALCWTWSNSALTRGYWYYCSGP